MHCIVWNVYPSVWNFYISYSFDISSKNRLFVFKNEAFMNLQRLFVKLYGMTQVYCHTFFEKTNVRFLPWIVHGKNSGWIKNFYKSDGKTGFCDAENGSEFTTGRFAEKTQKWEGLGISLTGSRLAHFSVCREHPRFQKGISAWKKVNAFFSRGASFWAKVSRSEVNIGPFRGWKAAQSPYGCAVFQPHSCSLDDRLAAKTCLPDSISRISVVKKSELIFFTFLKVFLHL